MKVVAWLTATVKKPETWMVSFIIIWFIGGALVLQPIHDRLGIVLSIIAFILWGGGSLISIDIYLQRADLEKWVYFSTLYRWNCIEKPLSTIPSNLSWVSLLVAIIFGISLIAIVLTMVLASVFVYVLWIGCDGDISKFGENINNYTSVILVFIFMAQAWIFYQQYHHMKQPLFKTTLLWALSKSNSDTDCGILLKNGGAAPIFNISYRISKVLVKDSWGYKGYKKVKSKEVSKDFLPRLDGGFEKEILENPTKEFEKMRLAVYISAKTLDGRSTSLFFYKARGDLDFRLAGIMHT